MDKHLKICRICLEANDFLYELFTTTEVDNETVELSKIMESFANVKVDVNDTLPTAICGQCHDKLIPAYKFKIQCENSYKQLMVGFRKERMESIKTDTFCEAFYNENANLKDSFDFKNALVKINSCYGVELIKKNESERDEVIAKGKSAEMKEGNVQVVTLSAKAFEKLDELHGENLINILREQDTIKAILNENNRKLSHIMEIDENNIFIVVDEDTRQKIPTKTENVSNKLPGQCRVKKERHKKIYPCPLCNKEIISQYGLKYHMKTHRGVKEFTCTYPNCTSSFYTKGSYEMHRARHTNLKKHVCHICGVRYNTANALWKHRMTHEAPKHHCKICEQKFHTFQILMSHMRSHDTDKHAVAVCEWCGKGYSRKYELKKHQLKCLNNKQIIEKKRKRTKIG